MLLGCYNDVLFVLSCRVNMSSINFPNIDHENLPKWEGDLAPLECIEVIEETHNVKSFRFKRSEEHTSELQSQAYLVCRLLLEKKKKNK